jgi:hypothetical protein
MALTHRADYWRREGGQEVTEAKMGLLWLWI